MSRAGRTALASDRARVNRLVAEAAERFQAAQEPEAPPEQPEIPPDVLLQWRSQRLYDRCVAVIVEKYPPLWPAPVIGSMVAEQWLQNLMQRMQEQAFAQASEAVALAAEAAASS